MAAFPNPFNVLRGPGRLTRGRPSTGAAYERDEASPFMYNWQPQLREAQADTREAYTPSAARVIDALHKSGMLKGGLEAARGQIISPEGLVPNLKPWGGVISSDTRIQAAWSRDVEGRFMLYCNDPWNVDFGGRYPLGQLLSQALNQYFSTGEMVATLPPDDRVGTTHATKLNLLPSSRLARGDGPGPNTIMGVTVNPRSGAPTAYTFDNFDLTNGGYRQNVVQARDVNGRPAVVHVLDNGPTAVRGITPLAPVLKIVKQYDQRQDAALTRALIQNIFAATVESEAPTADIMRALQDMEEQDIDDEDDGPRRYRQAGIEQEGVPFGSFGTLLEARAGWYKNTNIDLGRFGKIAHLFPGEKLNFTTVNEQGADYLPFTKILQREMARCAGITTYQLTGDFEGFTYTTAKMAVDDAWPMTLYRRSLVARICQTLFEAWLEEDIALGYTILPGGLDQFYRQRSLICRCDWRGPPRPTADDLKTAKANQILRAEGWNSTEQIASSYGSDWVEVADSQAETEQYRIDNDLPPLPSLGGGGNGAGSAPLAGGPDDPQAQSEQALDREARLTGAMMRGDDDEVDAVLMDFPNIGPEMITRYRGNGGSNVAR